jgi:hypothetical protein
LSKRKRKKRRGPTAEEKALRRAKGASAFTKLYGRQDRGEEIRPPTEGDDIKPFEGES